ncbi:MAG TPA: glycosyl hydrolase [Acidobacteriaceae bacterium]|nr:glycosyl hydrolase [Acidobacteriaceae bacterium]
MGYSSGMLRATAGDGLRFPHVLEFALGLALGLIALAGCIRLGAQSDAALAGLHAQFENPPDDSRILMRWWWFGPAATKSEVTRELEAMKAAGIGGVEIANLYALGLDDPATGFRNTPFLSPEHLEVLGFAAQEARRLGLRVDVTLGSGWPFGGPEIPVTEAAGKLRVEAVKVEAGASSAAAPFVDVGEEMLAVFVLSSADEHRGTGGEGTSGEPLALPVAGRFQLKAANEARTVLCFLSSRTGMVVKRPSVGAGGFVLDHYDKAATEAHLHAVGDKLLSAFGDHPPYAVFSDSLEDYGSDWSPALLSEFERRRGYDLKPHLMALVKDIGPETAAARHDWGRTLTEMADDGFLKPMQVWAAEHHTLLRSQTYGFPPVTLSSNRYTDLPEGEGKATFEMWREFSDTRWAASAGHLFHRPVISSETWTWLHSPAFRATPLDMKAEADLHFLQGINQLVGHGWPYSPEQAGEPGWRMYAASALNTHNPWWEAMPDLSRYLQRVSFALRQGEPANDVALLLPNDDVWASFHAEVQKHAAPYAGFEETESNPNMDDSMDRLLGKRVIAQVLDAGFNLDFIDADAIDTLGIPYRVLILPGVERLPVATYAKVVEFARRGGIVIATRRVPEIAPGLMHAEEDTARLKELSQTLFHGEIASAHLIGDESKLGEALASYMKPDVTLAPRTPEIGFIHRRLATGRKLAKGDLYFVANTSNATKHVLANFRDAAGHAEVWDAFTGEVQGLPDAKEIALDLAPYESRLIFFSDAVTAGPARGMAHESVAAELSHDWDVEFGKTGVSEHMKNLDAWTEDAKTRFFSGEAIYRKSFELHAMQAAGTRYWLDFGDGMREALPSPPGEHNMRAYLASPIREAAQVYVNGELAGVVWRPPYRLDVTRLLHGGENALRVVVGNTAINAMAGEPQPDYRLLWDRYGKLFEPQDMGNLQPLPSGMLGPVRLMESREEAK